MTDTEVTYTPVGGDVAVALDAARDNVTVLVGDIPHGGAYAIRDDVSVQINDYERYQPEPVRARGTVKALTADGFIAAYTHRTVNDARHGAVIYANPDACALVAVLDDDHGTHPGWRNHRINLTLQHTPEWLHWTGHQGLHSQAYFAEAIEEGQDEIVGTPNATVMLEIAQKFEASVGGKFRQEGRLDDGSVKFSYEETVDAKVGEGLIPVPKSFLVRVRPFWGAVPRDVEARVRYTCRGGELKIGYVLHRPDDVKRDAFATDVLGHVREELPDVVVVEGVPADPTPAGR